MMIDQQLVMTLCNLLDAREQIEQIEQHLNLIKQYERRTQESAIHLMKQSMNEKALQGAPVLFGHRNGPKFAFMRFGNRIDFQEGMIATEVSSQSPPSVPVAIYKMPPDDSLVLQPNVVTTIGEISKKYEVVPIVSTSGVIIDPFSGEMESDELDAMHDHSASSAPPPVMPQFSFLSNLISGSPEKPISPRVDEALWYDILSLHEELAARKVSPSTFWSTIAGNLNPEDSLPEDEKFGKREKTVTLQFCKESMDALKKWAKANNAKVAGAARSLMRFVIQNKPQLFEELRQLYDRVDSSEFFEVPQGEE